MWPVRIFPRRIIPLFPDWFNPGPIGSTWIDCDKRHAPAQKGTSIAMGWVDIHYNQWMIFFWCFSQDFSRSQPLSIAGTFFEGAYTTKLLKVSSLPASSVGYRCCFLSPSRKSKRRVNSAANSSRTFDRDNVSIFYFLPFELTMTQERTIPGCPWAFADDMRGIIDRKEFWFVTIITLQFICFNLCKHYNLLA